jgi:hypothetical protein
MSTMNLPYTSEGIDKNLLFTPEGVNNELALYFCTALTGANLASPQFHLTTYPLGV